MSEASGFSTPLTGMRVVDVSQQLPGPYSTLLLAGLGARVTKVEPPAGDAARRLDPAMFQRVSSGKSSIRLDLKTEDGRHKLHDLVRGADVFVEGFRPGVTARLGCDFPTLSRLNPRLVYCSISGFGHSGPDVARPTHDLSLQAIAGALPATPGADRVGVPWVDLGVATTAAFLVAAHWRAGRAIHLDLAMLDIASGWAQVKPEAVTAMEPTYGTFASSEGAVFALALLEDDMWDRLCRGLGLEGWSAEGGFEAYATRKARSAEVRDRISHELGRRTREQILDLATTFDLPLDEVHAAGDLEHEQVRWRRALANVKGMLPFGPGVGRRLRPFVQG